MRRLGSTWIFAIATAVAAASATAGPLADFTSVAPAEPSAPAPAFLGAARGRALSGPSTLPPEAAARAFLRAGVPGQLAPVRVELALKRQWVHRDGGAVVRFQQRLDDLDVFGAQVTVRLRADGAALWMMSSLVAPVAVGGARRITPMQAVDRAFLHYAPQRAGETSDGQFARAVIVALPGGVLRHGFMVDLPTRVEYLQALRCLIDAEDGSPLGVENRVKTANQARVWRINPTLSATTSLEDLSHVDAAQLYPADTLVKGQNCVDDHTLTTVMSGFGTFMLHFCTEVQTAARSAPGADWDFPGVTGAGSAKTGEGDGLTPNEVDGFDKFAEVHMYYHVRRAYDRFRALAGGTGAGFMVKQQPIPAIANYRLPFDMTGAAGDFQTQFANAQNPNGQLYPVDNAAFAPRGDTGFGVRNFDSMLFGQGSGFDFAYDGLTAGHEFTHAVIDTTTGLIQHRVDRWGLDIAPGAMNEGYADYFGGAFLDTPAMDSYLGPLLDQLGGERRRLDNANVCPTNVEGEVHHDSMPWSAALWAGRGHLGTTSEKATAFDAAVFRAMDGLVPNSSYEQAAMATLTELGAEPMFTAGEVAMARTDFTSRGQIACERVQPYDGPKRMLYIEGTRTSGLNLTPYMPGYLQFRYMVPVQASKLTVNIPLSQGGEGGQGGGGMAVPKLLVKRGADPIQFTYSGRTVAGNEDAELTTTMVKTTNGWSADVVADFAPGPVHVMIVNSGTSTTVAAMTTIGYTAGSNFEDAGVEPDAALEVDAGKPGGGNSEGCACETGARGRGAAATPALLAGVLLLAVLMRRRRRARG